jgi:hypothetical protein
VESLIQRLAALDPEAGDSLRVITHFDALIEGSAGLDAFVRAAAALAGCPAGLAGPERRIEMRIHHDGHRLDPAPGDRRWPTAALDGTGLVWLERADGARAALRLTGDGTANNPGARHLALALRRIHLNGDLP